MVSKKELLKNLLDYSPEEIAEAVKSGTVTLYELGKESEGAFTPLLKKKVKAILDRPEEQEPSKSDSPKEESPADVQTGDYEEVPSNELLPLGSLAEQKQEENQDLQSVQVEVTPSYDESDVIDNRGMFKKPFSFTGRIRRTEYGISFILYFIWYIMIDIAAKSPDLSQGTAIIILISIIPVLWFLWAQGCKRCHDRGNSGWYQLIPFYFLVLIFGDGEPGENDYGNNPKE